jgi:hypothetical protein
MSDAANELVAIGRTVQSYFEGMHQGDTMSG